MKSLAILLTWLLASIAPLVAQSNVRAHYTNGQVWIVWEVPPQILTNCIPTLTPALSNGVPVIFSNCVPQTCAIYTSPLPVTNTATATLLGRLFAQEGLAAILRDDIEASFGAAPTGFRIPDGAGGYRILDTNHGVFVHTVRSNFTAHYAVRPFGETNVPAAWRSGPVTATYSLAPEHAPTCHLQVRGTNGGYPVEWWTMWTDGDTNLASARPDFPLMANDHRRGVGHNFFVCEPRVGGLPASDIPACVALHSGDSQARMWLPDKDGFSSVGLEPAGSLLVALEDRLHMLIGGRVDPVSVLRAGYVPTMDPFLNVPFGRGIEPTAANLPPDDAVVFPYTLARFNWTLDWLYAHKAVDSNRVAAVGHSGGALGTLFWVQASPERFAAVNLYGPSLGDFPDGSGHLFGTRAQNLPLLLSNRAGQLVRATDLNQLGASFSPLRDLPFTRIFLGKREENWGVDDNRNYRGDIIEQYTVADQLGLGAAVFWDLREHGVEGWTYRNMTNKLANPPNCSPNQTVAISGSWSINDLWVPTLSTQFRRDDATNQIHHRADLSYPAFFNCDLRGVHGEPGRVIYTNTLAMSLPNYFDLFQPYDGLVTAEDCYPPFTGDHRGTWGGYFEWEPGIVDTPTNWSAVVFLVGAPSAFNPVEACPDASRVVDVAIRRPQQFTPIAGELIVWELRNAANNALFQIGTNVVGLDSLVSIPNLAIPRDPLRARLIVSLLAPPQACPAPQLFIQQLTNSLIELSWPSCPGNFYQVEWTRSFQDWQTLTPPLAALPTNGLMSWTTPVSPPFQFFRLVVRALTNSPVPTAPGIYGGRKMEYGGIVRNYRLNIPTNYTGAVPVPLALILHGHDQTADEFAGNQPALANYANAQGVILVIPDSTEAAQGKGWNTADPTPEFPVDDLGFLLALIDELDTALNLDRQRVYAGGFSNGGQMVHSLGARTTNVFAAFAAVGSAIAGERGVPGVLQYQPPPSQPVPVLIVNATNDCKRPFWGGINQDGALQPAAFESVAHWTNGNFCAPSPVITTNVIITNHVRRVFADACAGPYPPFNTTITNLVIREHYQLTCVPGTEVLFVTLTDGGHSWPEAADNVGFDTSSEVLQFFLRHCRCDAISATEPLLFPALPGNYDLKLCDQGYSRSLRLQVPAAYNPANATPLVFAMHGGGQTMREFASEHPALFNKCDFENMILVLPEALDHPVTHEPLWANKPFDYVADDRYFITNLIEHLAVKLNVDRARIYLTGFSGGGSFSHYFVATSPGIIAAIAPVCTQTGWNDPVTGLIPTPPAPLEPMPVMMVRGTADPKRPYNGGLNIDGVLCRSAADDVAYWTAGSLCAPAFTATPTPYGLNLRYPNCAGTTEVVLVRVDTMPHLWPDAADGFGFDANVSVIDFLLRHTR
jgi:polyhydroxybutyrate depolymerase